MRTGLATLMKDSAQDFVAFPKRKSTWVILAIGAVAALATHPADDYVERHIVGNEAADNFFSEIVVQPVPVRGGFMIGVTRVASE